MWKLTTTLDPSSQNPAAHFIKLNEGDEGQPEEPECDTSIGFLMWIIVQLS